MKKITALLLVVLMLAAMSVAVFARYEGCPECGGRMTEKTRRVSAGTGPCEKTGDPAMTDPYYKDVTTLSCTSCDYSETYEGERYPVCRH